MNTISLVRVSSSSERVWQNRVPVLGVALFLLALTGFLPILTSAQSGPQQTPTVLPTSTPIQSPVPTSTLTPTQTPSTATMGDLVEAYKNLIANSDNAVKAANRTVDVVLGLAAFVVTVLTATGLISVVRAERANRDLLKVASAIETAQSHLETLQKQSSGLEARVSELLGGIQTTRESLSSATTTIGTLQAEFEAVRQKQSDLIRTLDGLESRVSTDSSMLERWLNQGQIDQYELAAFAEDPVRRQSSKESLIAMADRDDPRIQWECLRVFGALSEGNEDWFDQRILDRTKWLAENSSERWVKMQAARTLGMLTAHVGHPGAVQGAPTT